MIDRARAAVAQPKTDLAATTRNSGDRSFRRDDEVAEPRTKPERRAWRERAPGRVALYRAGRFSYDESGFRRFYEASLCRLLDGLKE